MITRERLLNLLVNECNISKHLYTRIPADAFDYRPTPGQRSTLELLRYIAMCGAAAMGCMADGTFARWDEYEARTANMPHEEFPAMIDRQIEEIRDVFARFTDEEFLTRDISHAGFVMPMGEGVINLALGWLTAYRMQLFLYAKQAGAKVDGVDNWLGVDRETFLRKRREAAESLTETELT